MKIVVEAGSLAGALSLAEKIAAAKLAEKIAVLDAVHLAAKDGAVSVAISALDHGLTLSIPAMVEDVGELAVSAARLAALAAGFPPDSEIAINSDGKAARVSCGRSRFRLATLPIADLLSMPEIKDELGRVELEREQLLALLSRPAFAIAREQTHYYLAGVFLRDAPEGLVAVATDGFRLARVIAPGVAGLSQDQSLIISHATIKVLLKLLRDEAIETLILRRSRTLLEITGTTFSFVSKLIDGTFPDYRRLLPAATTNVAVVDRAALAQAVERIKAVAPDDKHSPLVGLAWTAPEPSLRLCVPRSPDADDSVAAETLGSGRVAIRIRYLVQLLDRLDGERVRLDAGAAPGSPVLIDDPTDKNFLALILPCVWGAEASEAA